VTSVTRIVTDMAIDRLKPAERHGPGSASTGVTGAGSARGSAPSARLLQQAQLAGVADDAVPVRGGEPALQRPDVARTVFVDRAGVAAIRVVKRLPPLGPGVTD
jgi:hypothetical protein